MNDHSRTGRAAQNFTDYKNEGAAPLELRVKGDSLYFPGRQTRSFSLAVG